MLEEPYTGLFWGAVIEEGARGPFLTFLRSTQAVAELSQLPYQTWWLDTGDLCVGMAIPGVPPLPTGLIASSRQVRAIPAHWLAEELGVPLLAVQVPEAWGLASPYWAPGQLIEVLTEPAEGVCPELPLEDFAEASARFVLVQDAEEARLRRNPLPVRRRGGCAHGVAGRRCAHPPGSTSLAARPA